MGVSEALDLANNSLATKHLAEIERKRITAQVKRRSSQLTQRTTQRSATDGAAKPSPQTAEAAYAARAAELGHDI